LGKPIGLTRAMEFVRGCRGESVRKIVFSAIATFIVLGLGLLFSPWATESFAKHKAINAFEEHWRNVQDGCGFNCNDCGLKTSEKVLFGRKVILEYACGLLPSDSPEYHKRIELFVSQANLHKPIHCAANILS
jgi:hypothetical protein